MFGWLKNKTAGRWSLYIVQNGHDQLALSLCGKAGAAPALAAVARMLQRYGDPEGSYRLCLVFNPTRSAIWLPANSFVDGKPSPALIEEFRKVDPNALKGSGRAEPDLEFIDPASGRPIDRSRLFARLWPASA